MNDIKPKQVFTAIAILVALQAVLGLALLLAVGVVLLDAALLAPLTVLFAIATAFYFTLRIQDPLTPGWHTQPSGALHGSINYKPKYDLSSPLLQQYANRNPRMR